MNLKFGTAWAGTEIEFSSALAAIEKYEAQIGALKPSENEGGVYQLQDGIAVVPVKGAMLNSDLPAEFTQVFGVTSYPVLQRTFAELAQNEDVKQVVLDVDSGGGQVAGLHETLEALDALRKHKPVATYAGNTIASAAYWLGSTTDELVMSPVGEAGSIGVIAVHQNHKGRLESVGVKTTVIRAGARKHLAHNMEDLSEQGLAEIQRSLDFHHGNFKHKVAENRNIPYAALDAGVGDGRTFYGREAVDVGLVDRIDSFDAFLGGLKGKIARQSVYVKGGFAAANSGVVDMNLEEALAKLEQLQGEMAAKDTALADAEARAVTAESSIKSLEAANAALAGTLATAQAANENFAALLEANIQAKAHALNTKVLMPSDLAGKQAINAQLEAEFQEKFPAGGVAAANAAVEPEAHTTTNVPQWAREFVQ